MNPLVSPRKRQAKRLFGYWPYVTGGASCATKDSATALLLTDQHTWHESSLSFREGSLSAHLFSVETKNPSRDMLTDSNTTPPDIKRVLWRYLLIAHNLLSHNLLHVP